MHMQNKRLTGFTLQGHANAGAYGSDIVCAAVSSAAYYAANTMLELVGDCDVQVQDGYLCLLTNQTSEKSDLLLNGFHLHMKALIAQYPKKLQIRYGGVTNASDKHAIIRS